MALSNIKAKRYTIEALSADGEWIALDSSDKRDRAIKLAERVQQRENVDVRVLTPAGRIAWRYLDVSLSDLEQTVSSLEGPSEDDMPAELDVRSTPEHDEQRCQLAPCTSCVDDARSELELIEALGTCSYCGETGHHSDGACIPDDERGECGGSGQRGVEQQLHELVALTVGSDDASSPRYSSTYKSFARMTAGEVADALQLAHEQLATADALAACTGSSSVRVTHERRDAATGELVVESSVVSDSVTRAVRDALADRKALELEPERVVAVVDVALIKSDECASTLLCSRCSLFLPASTFPIVNKRENGSVIKYRKTECRACRTARSSQRVREDGQPVGTRKTRDAQSRERAEQRVDALMAKLSKSTLGQALLDARAGVEL